MELEFFINEDEFRVILPAVQFIEKSDKEKYNSRQISGIISTPRKDRQGEVILAKGLDFEEFMENGHFNDNHSQSTSAIIGYPEELEYKSDLVLEDGTATEGYICRGYVVKGTKRADDIWELAKALKGSPRKLGFSIEGKVQRRKNKTIEKAKIRNVAITNCPVNTDATWEVLEKSFSDEDIAMKSMSATGVGGGAATGLILGTESLESDVKKVTYHNDDDKKKKKKKEDALKSILEFDDLLKAMDIVLDMRPSYDETMAAKVVSAIQKRYI